MTWFFGYGSLIWRPSFPFIERRVAMLSGYSRKLWQGSTDHRGTPGAPGRVATLVADAKAQCIGVAYGVAAEEKEAVIAHLDHREKGGYSRIDVMLDEAAHQAPRSMSTRFAAIMYVADEGNPEWLGPATSEAIAAQVAASVGPSGSNVEYVLRLCDALRELGATGDEEVFAIERLLRQRQGDSAR